MGLSKSAQHLQVLVVGTGAFAQGLVSLAQRSGATAGYTIRLGSRRVPSGSEVRLPELPAVPVCCIDDHIAAADMVFLAVPAYALPGIVTTYGKVLSGKVVVDVTNATKNELCKVASAAGIPVACTDSCIDLESNKDVAADLTVRVSDSGSVSTPASVADWLSSVLPGARLVKAFCNLSAYTLLHGDPLTEVMKSVAASDSLSAAADVADLGRAMGLEMRMVPSLTYAAMLEKRQHSLLPAWQWPTWLMLGSWLVVHIYSSVRYNVYGGTPWENITMFILNKSVGWVGLLGMVYTYLPGVIVCYMQLLLRQPTVRLPGWLKAWMDARKQLGLLSLAAVLLHLLLSTFLWMPAYYSKLWDSTASVVTPSINGTALDDKFGLMKAGGPLPRLQVLMPPANTTNIYAVNKSTIAAGPDNLLGAAANATAAAGSVPMLVLSAVSNVITLRSRLNWIGEASTFLGILSGCLMGVIGITSVPCVTPKMNWREWRLLQSHGGWLAVLTATVHVVLLGAPAWPRYKTEWPLMLPTITLLSTIPPMLLLVFKLLICVPPLSIVLSRVRSGAWAAKGSGGVASMAVYALKSK